MRGNLLPALSLFVFLACSSAPQMPEGSGKGMLSWDRQAPEGAVVYEKPLWTQGDRFLYIKGGQEHLDFRVTLADPEKGYELEEHRTGLLLRLDAGFAEVERAARSDSGLRRLFAPKNPEVHFPLWVGKKWSASYLDKDSDGRSRPILAEFHCDAVETLDTAAGRFSCLRIWEQRRLDVPGKTYLARVALHWYSPEVGWLVRSLEGGTLQELETFERQRR